ITVVATQDTVETDSTDNQYDADALYPVVAYAPVEIDEDGNVASDVILQSVDKVEDTTTPVAQATVPAGAKIEEGKTELTLTINEAANPSNITVSAVETAKTLEVKMENLHEDNTVLIKVELFVGKELSDFKLYHSGVLMTAKETLSEVVADQEYYYDSETGIVTMLTLSFSPFTYTYQKANWIDKAAAEYSVPVEGKSVTVTSAEELALFAKQVNSGTNYSGYTVKLTSDIDLDGDNRAWTPINGFTGTFDGQDHTIGNLWVYGGTEGSGFGLFGKSNPKAINDLKIHNAYVYGNSAIGAVLGSGNTTVTNVHVSGVIQIGTTTQNGHIANFNSSYIGGIIGYGYSKINNCSVKGDEGSVIGGGRQVGGIYGFSGEGKADRASGCTVENVKLIGTRCVGGIIGWAHYGNNVKNCNVVNVALEVTGTETTTIGLITGTSYTYTGAKNYDEFVGNTATGCTMTVNGTAHTAEAPFDMYAPYASGACYIKRGENTYIYCETVEQANGILEDGDVIVTIS
ncbi:MAG: hypothetical protein ACI4SC_00550, partial [Candidatus Neoclostridium sp.]